MAKQKHYTIGTYIAKRLEQIGLSKYFAIPGDFNLTLLDEVLKNPKLEMVNCCNELNAGYAADGYARSFGVSAVFVTYSVGGLSIINAIAGAYAEDLPVIVISGGPNSHSAVENQLLHHTLGKVNYRYVKEIFDKVTCHSVAIRQASDAPLQIDGAIQAALKHRKPVYIEVACNLANFEISQPNPLELSSTIHSDPDSIKAAIEHAANFLNHAEKPVLVAGSQLRAWHAIKAFHELAQSCNYAVATMPNAKGFFPENHPCYIGTYWGVVSTPGCNEIVQSSDAYLFAGPLFSDYTTVGFSALINPEKLIQASPGYVRIQGESYHHIALDEFLQKLKGKLKKNKKSVDAFNRIRSDAPYFKPEKKKGRLTTRTLYYHIQKMIDSNSTVVAETGDAWFNSMRLKLPERSHFEIQMQYGSIGWSVGAVLGLALNQKQNQKVIGLIGDGSFQMAAQEVSTMIRYNVNAAIFLINNRGYTIEVQIHDGPYNNIKNWRYADLVSVFNAENGKGWSKQVRSEPELIQAIQKAKAHKGLSLIEVIIDRDDCNKSLLEWGTRVATNNSRPPH